ncbi:MAG: ABC-F family ATP-binding cassette domain-containing protein [Caldisericaceae bacterium]|nr:ABC-F family ATP-binding cassette domain-containing protein [Caldisericaceae bacterium]
MIQIGNITFINAGKKILDEISFSVNREKKIIVGENGSGKTTLLEIIAGNLSPDSGTIVKKGKLAYIPQEIPALNRSGMEEIESAFYEIKKIEKELDALEKAGDFGERYASLLAKYEEAGGYTYKQEILTMLDKIGLSEKSAQRKMMKMSGGERTKCEIAKAFLSKADILLMDEPTNHLDIDTIELLEELLKKFRGDLLIVSHDRVFIDKIATHILYLSGGKIREYPGDYEKFTALRKAEDEKIAKEREKLLKYIEKERAFIEKFRYGTRAAQAKSREKKLKKIEIPGEVKEKKIKVRMESAKRGGEKVAEIINLEKSYGKNKVLKGVNLFIRRGDRIGITGKNGSGKSTLLKIIAGVEKQDNGEVKIGPGIEIGYFPQDAFVMDPGSTLVSQITDAGYTVPEARNILALFDFTGDEVFKTVSELSGGEKRRLLLAKVSLVKANFLVLDEPTNHLSISMKETVLNALKNYNGTILLVTHDRYVLQNLTDKIYRMENGKLVSKKKKPQSEESERKDVRKEINKIKSRIAYLEKLLSENPENSKRKKELKLLKQKLQKFL